MAEETYQNPLKVLLRLPGVYHVAAFIAGRRVAVRGWSMYPSLAPGERVLFDRLAYISARPQRGDIVLAVHPARPHVRMIKRVAAVPGDAVATDGMRCWVNGELADRRPTGAGESLQDSPPRSRSVKEGAVAEAFTLPPRVLARGEYFLLGDALDSSTDSRRLGPVRRRDILARGWLVYWPADRFRLLRW